MPIFAADAIVTHSIHYGESDKIVTFFTQDFGKVKGIAKGARRSKKRFQNALSLFSHLRLVFFDREGMGLVRVQGCDILNSFPKIREDLRRIIYGSYFLEMINEMAGEREAHAEAFDLVLSFLKALEETEPREEQLRVFEIRMLTIFGYQPNLKMCPFCKRDWEALKDGPSVFFSIERGTILCRGCSRPADPLIPLSLGTARLIDGVSETELSKIHRFRFTPQALSETRELLPHFISYQLGKELKSLKVLGALARPFLWEGRETE